MNKRQFAQHLAKITYLAASGNYIYIHFADAPRQLYARTLSSFALDLPQFVRIHKSYLVNPGYVTRVDRDALRGASLLIGADRLPVSKRRFKEIKLRFSSKASSKSMRNEWHYIPLVASQIE